MTPDSVSGAFNVSSLIAQPVGLPLPLMLHEKRAIGSLLSCHPRCAPGDWAVVMVPGNPQGSPPLTQYSHVTGKGEHGSRVLCLT